MRVALDQTATSMVDPSLPYKSSARHLYDAARLAAGCAPLGKPIHRGREKNDEKDPFARKPPFDVLMYNEAGEVTECSIANIALCLLYTSPSPRDGLLSRMPSSA